MNIFITSIRVYSRTLSVTFGVSFDDTKSLQSLIRKPLRFAIYAGMFPENGTATDNAPGEIVWFRGKIVSIGKNYFVVHTAINMAVLFRLVKARKTSLKIRIDRDGNYGNPMRENKQVNLSVSSGESAESRSIENKNGDNNEALLRAILHSASQKLGIQEEELIYRFTTYTKNGKVYEGKRNLDDVSEKQRIIVFDRVKKLLKEERHI